MRKNRVVVYIDGSNFFFYCKAIGIPTHPNFDFEKFILFLLVNDQLIAKKYYIGGVKAQAGDKKAINMMRKQMSFFSYLKKYNWEIHKGYLLKYKNQFHEKGVDVKLALDLALDAVDDKYDRAILLSSDTDILPAVIRAQKRNKKIIYVGFANRPSKALISQCDSYKLLTLLELKKFVLK